MKRYTDEDLLIELEHAVQRAGSQRRFAKASGLSPTFVSMVMNGQARPGPVLAAFLGFREDEKRWVRDES